MKKNMKRFLVVGGIVCISWLGFCVVIDVLERMSECDNYEGILVENPRVVDKKLTTGIFNQPKGVYKNIYYIDMDGDGTMDKVEEIKEKFPSNLKKGDYIKVSIPFLAGPFGFYMKKIEKAHE